MKIVAYGHMELVLPQLSENVAVSVTDFSREKVSSGTYIQRDTSNIYGHKDTFMLILYFLSVV